MTKVWLTRISARIKPMPRAAIRQRKRRSSPSPGCRGRLLSDRILRPPIIGDRIPQFVSSVGGRLLGLASRLVQLRCSGSGIDLGRSAIIQCLVRPLLVIEGEVFPQPANHLAARLIALEIQIFVLDRAPEALYEDVVQS